MPIYTYKCDNCGCGFEQLKGVTSDKSSDKCPKCKSRKITRTLSSFSVGSSHSHGASDCGHCSFEGNGCPGNACPAGFN